jgi:DNA-binding response OmpR family regulator
MKVLIHRALPHKLDVLLDKLVIHGYRAGIAQDGTEILNMLSDTRYDIVLTDADMKKLTLPCSSLVVRINTNVKAILVADTLSPTRPLLAITALALMIHYSDPMGRPSASLDLLARWRSGERADFRSGAQHP